MITWNEFAEFALPSVLLWMAGAIAAWKGRPYASVLLTVAGLCVYAAFIAVFWTGLHRPPLRTLFHDAVRNPHLRQVALPVDYVLFHGRSFRIHHDEPAEAGDTRASLDAGIAKCLVHPARNGLHVLLFRVGMCFHPCGSRNHTTYGTLSPHS